MSQRDPAFPRVSMKSKGQRCHAFYIAFTSTIPAYLNKLDPGNWSFTLHMIPMAVFHLGMKLPICWCKLRAAQVEVNSQGVRPMMGTEMPGNDRVVEVNYVCTIAG